MSSRDEERTPLQRRLAELDAAEPSEELDRIVLARAREAIHSSPPLPVHRALRWALPVSLAATLLLLLAGVLLDVDGPARSPRERAAVPVARNSAPSPAAAAGEVRPLVLQAPRVPAEDPGRVAATAGSVHGDEAAAWLARIDALLAAGDTVEAEKQLRAFRKAYPARTAAPALSSAPETQ